MLQFLPSSAMQTGAKPWESKALNALHRAPAPMPAVALEAASAATMPPCCSPSLPASCIRHGSLFRKRYWWLSSASHHLPLLHAAAAASFLSVSTDLRPPLPLSKQVAGGKQRLLERGELRLSVLDAAAAVPARSVMQASQLAAAPAPHTPPAAAPPAAASPPGKQPAYPEGHGRPASAGSKGHTSSRGNSDSEGEAAGSGRQASRIVAAVGGTGWELLPASQTLKVRHPAL